MDKIVCTVKRSKWARGGKNGCPALLNADGNMCCLGFLGEACGVPTRCLRHTQMPQGLISEEYKRYPRDNTYKDGAIHWDVFANINDDPHMSEEDRERQLTQRATDTGFTFIFED